MSIDKALLDSIMKGIELEKETFDFYTRAEHKTFNPEAKRIFRWLARFEEAHYLKLTELYSALSEGGRWVFYGGSTIELAPSENVGAVRFDTDETEAIKIALDIERRGAEYYSTLLAQTSDPEGRIMIQALYDEELEHMRILSEKLEAIQKNG